MDKKSVLVGISGGLDSTFVAYWLKHSQGYTVEGVHFSNGFVSDETIATIKKTADFLGINVRYVDLHEQFRELLQQVDIEMCHQRTPNICVMCCRDIKFSYCRNYALRNGFDYFATGHYVKIIHGGDDVIVRKGIDETRDQSYGFSVIPKESLRHVLTPLGDFTKAYIRQLANEIGLPYLSKESHGLCFTKKPWKEFYKSEIRKDLTPGKFIVVNPSCSFKQSEIEKANQTPHIGQELYVRGEKVTVGKFQCVVDRKEPNGNIILTQRDAVFESQVKFNNLNWFIDRREIDLTGGTFRVMIRYNSDPFVCDITSCDGNAIIVRTAVPMYAPTIGQIATIYDGDRIIVGGFIF